MNILYRINPRNIKLLSITNFTLDYNKNNTYITNTKKKDFHVINLNTIDLLTKIRHK